MVKKIVSWGLLAFLVFFVATRPGDASNIVQSLLNGVRTIGAGFGEFLTGLF